MSNVVAWKERFPSVELTIEKIERKSTKKEGFSWLENTHEFVILTGTNKLVFRAVVHMHLVGMLKQGSTVVIWYSFTDPMKRFNRYVEILCINEK